MEKEQKLLLQNSRPVKREFIFYENDNTYGHAFIIMLALTGKTYEKSCFLL